MTTIGDGDEKLFLAGDAALLLATGAAHAGPPREFQCGKLFLTYQSVTGSAAANGIGRYSVLVEGVTTEPKIEVRWKRETRHCRECVDRSPVVGSQGQVVVRPTQYAKK
jgi:hypothetical protein